MSDEKGKKKRKAADAPTPLVQSALPAEIDPFAEFVAVLKEKDPELSSLEKPARTEAVDQAEGTPQEQAPAALSHLPVRWNGGTAHEACIYGVGTGDEFDLVELNHPARADDLPEHLLGFAATVQGEIYCFDLSRLEAEGDSPVVLDRH